jgi:surface protein
MSITELNGKTIELKYKLGGSQSTTPTGYRFTSNEELKNAVNEWCQTPRPTSVQQYGHISTWDVSQITDMSMLFFNKDNFNDDISRWNVGNVITMKGMFSFASSFNQPIEQWNVSNVTNMQGMFNGASVFNQPLAQWERNGSTVGNVTNMDHMFSGAPAFNQPLEQWNVGNVTNMREMFYGASVFNQPLAQWTVSNVTTMEGIFYGASTFNQPLNGWDVRNVTTMKEMFRYASVFNQPLHQWNVGNVTNMSFMFYKAYAFNQPLEQWNVSNVTTMEAILYGASTFNQPLYGWTLRNDVDIENMLVNALAFTYDEPQPGQRGQRSNQIIPINYTNVSNQLVQNNNNLLESTLTDLKNLHDDNKLNLLYLSAHGSTNDDVFMVPDNVWIIFTSPNKEPTLGAPDRSYISGNPEDIQNILRIMHEGNYNNLNNNNTFNEQFRIYPPGGITQDLNLNPYLIYETGAWTFSGIMKSENYLKEFDRDELIKLHGISTTKPFRNMLKIDILKHLLLYNDTSDFHFCWNLYQNNSVSLKDLLDKRKRKYEKLVLFISACRVLSIMSEPITYEDCNLISNNKYNIPIPSKNPISLATNPMVSLRQRTMGIGNTIIDTNYYWLRDNKEVIKREINKTSYDMKTLLTNLLMNEKISLSNYCKLLKKITEIFN